MIPRRLATSLLLTALSLASPTALVGCAPEEPAGPTPSVSATAPTSEPGPTPSPTVTTDPGDVTCESLLPDAVLAAFAATEWLPEEELFRVGSIEIEEGTWCKWGDHSASGAAQVQIYGWAPLAEADALQAQRELVDQGWVREEIAAGVIVTEDPSTAVWTDDQGYGTTYLFGDGWVKVSDTRQGLLVIHTPGG